MLRGRHHRSDGAGRIGEQKSRAELGRKTLVLQAKLLIGGDPVAADHGATYEHVDPVTDEIATLAAAASVDDAIKAGNASAAAFPHWSTRTAQERAAVLQRAAEQLVARADDFVSAMAAETGAAESWARFNCQLGAEMFVEAAGVVDRLGEVDAPSEQTDTQSWLVRQPAGVVLGIAPWNAPVVLGVRAVAAPLALGNTVVLKASEICPKTHSLIAEVISEAGLPPGALNLVTNAPQQANEIVEVLVGHSAVRRVNFTGSTRVGRVIAEICARHLKPCLLELSGKSPLLVLDDADLPAAVDAAAFGTFFNQGQICMSTERIIVDSAVADAFVGAFADKARSLKAGDPRQGDFPLGSLISKEAAARVSGLVEDALAKGATLIAGGDVAGTIMQATVLDRVTSSMRIYNEESFGPVASIVRVDGIDEAVSVANDTEYGLAAAVFGRDIERAKGVARRIESGICHINGPTVHDEPGMPFGGVKASGYGRFGGQASVQEFTELRWISHQKEARQYPI